MGALKAAGSVRCDLHVYFNKNPKVRLPVVERLPQQQPLQPFRTDKQSDPLQSDKEINFHLVYASALTLKNMTHVSRYDKHGRDQQCPSDNPQSPQKQI